MKRLLRGHPRLMADAVEHGALLGSLEPAETAHPAVVAYRVAIQTGSDKVDAVVFDIPVFALLMGEVAELGRRALPGVWSNE